MTTIVIATPDAVLVVRKGHAWTVEAHLERMKAQALAVDENGGRLYVGTSGKGLFRSTDGGHVWEELSLPHNNITAVAVQGHARDGAAWCMREQVPARSGARQTAARAGRR